MNIKDRIAWLQEAHATLNHKIDDLEKHSIPNHNKITEMKKKRLAMKDEIAKLNKQMFEESHERAFWDN